MNLVKMFEMQKVLDDHIMDEHPELIGQDNLDWKVLALLVEVSECANEWRGFKKWSKDQEPRVRVIHRDPHGQCEDVITNPLLEEYVDGLHFVLSIGLELGIENFNIRPFKYKDVTTQFNAIFSRASKPRLWVSDYIQLCDEFLGLGQMLGFTWEQIEKAYMEKNAINHERQNNGY